MVLMGVVALCRRCPCFPGLFACLLVCLSLCLLVFLLFDAYLCAYAVYILLDWLHACTAAVLCCFVAFFLQLSLLPLYPKLGT